MKQLFFTFLLAIPFISRAQDCSNFYYGTVNSQAELSTRNAKGELTERLIYKVLSVSNDSGGVRAELETVKYNGAGKQTEKRKSNFRCNGSTMVLGAPLPASTGDETTESTKGVWIEYPLIFKEGQALKDVGIDFDGRIKGIKVHINVQIRNRRVVAQERMTTPVGNWFCFKITYDIETQLKIFGKTSIIHQTGSEWFAPGFGIVKSELSRDGILESSSVLTLLKE